MLQAQDLQILQTIGTSALWVEIPPVPDNSECRVQKHPEVGAKDEAQAEKRGAELLALVRNARRIKEQEQAS